MHACLFFCQQKMAGEAEKLTNQRPPSVRIHYFPVVGDDEYERSAKAMRSSFWGWIQEYRHGKHACLGEYMLKLIIL